MALYPPILASSMPAFDAQSKNIRIYFTLSEYNTIKKDEIKSVDVTVRYQSSNMNALKDLSEIINKPFNQDELDIGLNRYYVLLESSDLKNNFQVDKLYKLQLRLRNSTLKNTSFTIDDINNTSLWSTVCILKPIIAPLFYIDDFHVDDVENQQGNELDLNVFDYSLADFIGIYKQGSSSLTLKSWRIRLLSKEYTEDLIKNIDNYTLSDSGIKFVSAYNYNYFDSKNGLVLECSLPYELSEEEGKYNLLFEITTKNDYTGRVLYNFLYSPQTIDAPTGNLKVYTNEEEGYIKIVHKSNTPNLTNYVLRRSDSKSNFLDWEDLKNFQGDGTNFTYYDFTALSGLAYRYLLQKRDARGRRSTPLYDLVAANGSATVAEWEHAFLLESTGNGEVIGTKQLKLKFDFQISSYKTNIAESKTDTIGSRYPFIRRNGNMYYRSFPCSGTITEYMDEASLFTNIALMYDGYYNIYKEYRGEIYNYATQYDYTKERKFREKVELFLYNAKPKLYKSMQEGNIFIKLMEVSLTPKNELGRLVYSFSATAYEIDYATIPTYNKYGLISIGTFNPEVYNTYEKMAQLNTYKTDEEPEGNLFEGGKDIIGTGAAAAANSIAAQCKYNQIFNGTKVIDIGLTWLRLIIDSPPYLIKEENGIYSPVRDTLTIDDNGNKVSKEDVFGTGNIDYQLYQIESTYSGNNIYLGHLFTINGKQIIISYPNNIYEIKLDNVPLNITSLIPAKNTLMSVDYRANIIEIEDTSKVPKIRRSNRINGQLIGTYDFNHNIISEIIYKYKFSYTEDSSKVERIVNGVNSILIDTEPSTVIYLKTSVQNQILRFVVNETGELRFDPGTVNVYINSLKFYGINIKKPDNILNAKSLDDIKSPQERTIYQIQESESAPIYYYYYYKRLWHLAELQDNNTTLDIQCPVDALIFYLVSVRRDYY